MSSNSLFKTILFSPLAVQWSWYTADNYLNLINSIVFTGAFTKKERKTQNFGIKHLTLTSLMVTFISPCLLEDCGGVILIWQYYGAV